MPVQQARMELAEGTEAALAGQIEAQVKEDTLRLLEPTLCLLCIGHTFGRAVMINAPCQHHFHRRCIDPVLEGDGAACPCRTPLRPGQERLLEVLRHRQMMDGLSVKCPQCEELLRFEQLDGHVRNADGCPNTPFRCGNEGCGALFLRKDKEEHLSRCPHRIATCGQCNAPVKSGELQQHEREQCPRRKVRCPHCQKEYICCEKGEHERECTGSVPMKSLTELREMIIQQQQVSQQQQQVSQQQQQTFERQVGQLREQAAQQQQTIERQGQTIQQLQHTNAQQQQTNAQQQQSIERQGQTIQRQGQTIQQLQHTNAQQQREIAELREVTRPLREEQQRCREEQQRRREEQEREQQRRRAEQQRQEAEHQEGIDAMRYAVAGAMLFALYRERALLPQKLHVEGASCALSGEYSLRPERVNGAAVWGKGHCRLYRTRDGHWGLTHEADGPQRNHGDLRLTSQPGSLSPVSEGGWEWNTIDYNMSRAGVWKPADHVRVRAP